MTDSTKYICPICAQLCNYNHIVDFHRDFWDNKFPTDHMPNSAEKFNQRFAALGFTIKDLADASKDIE